MDFRALSGVAAIIAATVPFTGQAANPPTLNAPRLPAKLTLAMAPGGARELVKNLLLKPYANASLTTLGDALWTGPADPLPDADILLLDGLSLTTLCRAQKLEKLDWSSLGRDRYLPIAASACGAGAFIDTTILAWDKKKLTAPPGWADFWDVARHPGRRGLRRAARGNLEIALLADGVAAGDIYRVLRSNDGVDRAFRKLDQLKPYIEWWTQPGEPVQFLAAGRVLLTSAPAAQTMQANATRKTRLGVQWAGNLSEVESLALPRGGAQAKAAVTALQIAADPARQAEFARATGLGPAVVRSLDMLPAENLAASPSLDAHQQEGVALDDGFWADNGATLEARFVAWLAK